VLYRLKKDYVGAGKLIDAVLEKSPGLPSALEQEAFLREAQAKPSDAVTILKRILVSTQKATYSRTESDFRSETMVNLALALNWLGKHDEAIQIWDELAAFSPKQAPLAAREKAFLLLAGGQKAQALTTLEGQLRSSPDDADLVISHAFLLLNSDRSDNAATELNDYVKRQPGFRAWLAVAAVEERRKDFTGALAALAAAEKFVRSLDQLRTVNEYRAMFFDQNQQVDSAEAEYRQIVLREPNNSDALNSLGYFFAQHRIKLDEAEQLLKRALIMNPMNANYQDSLGNL